MALSNDQYFFHTVFADRLHNAFADTKYFIRLVRNACSSMLSYEGAKYLPVYAVVQLIKIAELLYRLYMHRLSSDVEDSATVKSL